MWYSPIDVGSLYSILFLVKCSYTYTFVALICSIVVEN